MKITKKHIGTTVWLVPEGNEVRRAEVKRVIEAATLRQKIERALCHLPADKILAIADIAGVR